MDIHLDEFARVSWLREPNQNTKYLKNPSLMLVKIVCFDLPMIVWKPLTSESIKPNHPRTPQGEGTLITTIDTRKSKVTKIPLEVPAS